MVTKDQLHSCRRRGRRNRLTAMRLGRGESGGVAVLAAVSLLLLAASPASAEVERTIRVQAGGQATNGYSFSLNAYREQPGGGIAVLELQNKISSAAYVQRRPAKVSKRGVVAEFGDLGRVRFRVEKQFTGGQRRCNRSSFSLLRGTIRFDGERGYSRIRSTDGLAFMESRTARGKCAGGSDVPIEPALRRASRETFLASCGRDSGAGFFAAEPQRGAPADFLASKVSVEDELMSFRNVLVSGSNASFAPSPDLSRVRITPPQPFAGRAFYADGVLNGNARVALPGLDSVRLAPTEDAQAGGFDDVEIPKCFFPLLLADFLGPAARTSVDERLTRSILDGPLLRLARRAGR